MLFGLSSFGQVVHNGVIVPESDSTVVQRRVAELRDSLNNRNFSEDTEAQSTKAFYIFARTAKVLFRIGAAMELHRLGYKFELLNPSESNEVVN